MYTFILPCSGIFLPEGMCKGGITGWPGLGLEDRPLNPQYPSTVLVSVVIYNVASKGRWAEVGRVVQGFAPWLEVFIAFLIL